MALSHNVLVLGLNSIYLPAPHIIPADAPDFINDAMCWTEVLDAHHEMEETSSFRTIERITGEGGVMDGNIKEHQAFILGLQAYKSHLLTLHTQLTSEIPSLLSLSRLGSSLPLLSLLESESPKISLRLPRTGGTIFFVRNLDTEFEDGRWREWPGVPGLLWWGMMRSVWMWNGDGGGLLIVMGETVEGVGVFERKQETGGGGSVILLRFCILHIGNVRCIV